MYMEVEANELSRGSEYCFPQEPKTSKTSAQTVR